MNYNEKHQIIVNYLLNKLEEDLNDESIVYSGNVLFSDLDRLCEEVVKLYPRSNLWKEAYQLNVWANLNWEDQHFDLVQKQTKELIELVRKENNK